MIQPIDFLRVAQELANGSHEADRRSAVSRAYYATFHAARSLLEAFGSLVPFADQAHAYIWKRLSNTGQTQVDQAGRSYSSLRTERNRADYDIQRNIFPRAMRQSLQNARSVIQVLEQADKEPLRSQVITAIRQYETTVLKEDTFQP